MLLLAETANNEQEARKKLQDTLDSGQAVANLKDLVAAQGGDSAPVEDPALLPQAKVVHAVTSPQKGYISQLDAMEVGLTALELGAGRKKKNEPVDYAVGIVLHKKIGDRVERGEDLATIHAQSLEDLEQAQGRLLTAYDMQEDHVKPPPLIHSILR